MRRTRFRGVLLVSIAITASTWALVDSAAPASGVEIGPLPVPVELPPLPVKQPVQVDVTVPKKVVVGPVVVTAPDVVPGLGVSVTVSPTDGVSVGVTVPKSVAGAPLPQLPPVTTPTVPVVGGGSVVVSPVPPAHTTSPVAGGGGSGVIVRTPAGASRVGQLPSASSPTRIEATPDAVNASLTRESPSTGWVLFRQVASNHLLWLALLAFALVARWAVAGMVRDARRARLATAV